MSTYEIPGFDPDVYVDVRMQWLGDAVEVLGHDRTADPLEVFASPTEVRDDAEPLELTVEQENSLRSIAGRFGIGGEVDVVSTAEVQILEGGKVWKIEAEAEMPTHADTIMFAGSPRVIIGPDEVEYLMTKYGVDLEGATQYDAARFLAGQQDGFVTQEDEELPYGYEVAEGFVLTEESTGQRIKIGEKDGRPVVLLRVDREDYTDEEGEPKYRQPQAAALMTFMSNILSAEGNETASVALVTSTTYASRVIDAMRAGLESGRFFDVSMYGRQTLATVRGLEVAKPTSINQIPGELRVVYEKLVSFAAELARD